MADVRLKMKFKDEFDKIRIITVNNCKTEITTEEQKTLMDTIIREDVFATSNGSLVQKVSSEVISTTVTPFELV